ncbi:MAG: HK97 family phage prohead protease [Sphingobium sp.]
MQNRAYSFITIKALNEEDRIIEGVATTPSPDRVGDVVNPMGAKFSLPLPFLWQHNHDEPIGHVIEATPTKEGISFKAQIATTDEPGKLKELLDFAWQCIKMKLVAAVSIGFRPVKYAFISDGGIEYDEWDWFELSAVTIPAQAEATITSVKSIDMGLRKAAGVPDPEIPQAPEPAASGKSVRIVKLEDPARDRAKPFVINRIVRTGQD